jgi:hypothetical protein
VESIVARRIEAKVPNIRDYTVWEFRNGVVFSKELGSDYWYSTLEELKEYIEEKGFGGVTYISSNMHCTFKPREIRLWLDNTGSTAIRKAAELVGGYDNLVLFNSLKPIDLINRLSEQDDIPWELVERAYLSCELKINFLQEDGSMEEVEQIVNKYNTFLASLDEWSTVNYVTAHTLNVDPFAFKPKQ